MRFLVTGEFAGREDGTAQLCQLIPINLPTLTISTRASKSLDILANNVNICFEQSKLRRYVVPQKLQIPCYALNEMQIKEEHISINSKSWCLFWLECHNFLDYAP